MNAVQNKVFFNKIAPRTLFVFLLLCATVTNWVRGSMKYLCPTFIEGGVLSSNTVLIAFEGFNFCNQYIFSNLYSIYGFHYIFGQLLHLWLQHTYIKLRQSLQQQQQQVLPMQHTIIFLAWLPMPPKSFPNMVML